MNILDEVIFKLRYGNIGAVRTGATASEITRRALALLVQMKADLGRMQSELNQAYAAHFAISVMAEQNIISSESSEAADKLNARMNQLVEQISPVVKTIAETLCELLELQPY
jgi:hypothetical protein